METETPMMVCESCGRAYGKKKGEAPYTAEEARFAALLTGWEQDKSGKWFCGLSGCNPSQDAITHPE